jgi:hypothetical protein
MIEWGFRRLESDHLEQFLKIVRKKENMENLNPQYWNDMLISRNHHLRTFSTWLCIDIIRNIKAPSQKLSRALELLESFSTHLSEIDDLQWCMLHNLYSNLPADSISGLFSSRWRKQSNRFLQDIALVAGISC